MEKKSPSQLGALWVNQTQNGRGPVLTGEVDGQRVVVFANKYWSEAEQKKQPRYHILKATAKKS